MHRTLCKSYALPRHSRSEVVPLSSAIRGRMLMTCCRYCSCKRACGRPSPPSDARRRSTSPVFMCVRTWPGDLHDARAARSMMPSCMSSREGQCGLYDNGVRDSTACAFRARSVHYADTSARKLVTMKMPPIAVHALRHRPQPFYTPMAHRRHCTARATSCPPPRHSFSLDASLPTKR